MKLSEPIKLFVSYSLASRVTQLTLFKPHLYWELLSFLDCIERYFPTLFESQPNWELLLRLCELVRVFIESNSLFPSHPYRPLASLGLSSEGYNHMMQFLSITLNHLNKLNRKRSATTLITGKWKPELKVISQYQYETTKQLEFPCPKAPM